MSRKFLILILMIFLVGSVLASEKIVGVDFGDEDEIEVVVKLGVGKNVRMMSVSSGKKVDVPKYEVRVVTRGELKKMEKDSEIEKVFNKNYIRAFLEQATGIVNSSRANNLSVGILDLNGSGQTVCVVDTGVNFSHPDLAGKNVSCVVDCFGKACVENCSVGDNNGHGTHVAGIVAASGGITGVAPNVSLIGVKILGSDSGGSGDDADLNNAVDWCVARNVSVITMSLGTVTLFDSYCDGAAGLGDWRDSINAAYLKNISVVVASGNDANTTHISAPACIQNATAVGDTYDANIGSVGWGNPQVCSDSTTALDKIVCHANRNSLVRLFAPGSVINSTMYTGGYETRSGTSMAAPMVAGSIALIKQYLDFSGQAKTPAQIEDVLNDTGKVLYDEGGSGENFSRIDVYAAVLSLDVTAPNVTLVSPVDDKVNLSVNQSFGCNATDWQLANLTLRVWNSSELYYNETVNLTGSSNETSFSLVNLSEGTYDWNCFVYDDEGNLGSASANSSLTVGGIEVELDSPDDASYTNMNETNFSCTAFSASIYELSNVTFYLWNYSSGNLIYNLSGSVTGVSNSSVFNFTLGEEGNYSWNCLGVNNASNESLGSDNFTVIYDVTAPVLSVPSESVTSSSSVISWTTGEAANSSVAVSGGSWSNSSSYVTDHSISVSGLSSSTGYSYTVWSCDEAGNCGSDSGSFTTSATSSSSGGGGGGSSTISVINIGSEKLWKGASELLKANDKVSFSLVSGSHSLEVEKVGVDYAQIVIMSEPVYLNLSVGEEVKLNLSSIDYYDLIVGLNGILNGEANISVKRIFETIVVEEEELSESEGIDEDRVFRITEDEPKRDWRGFVLLGVVVFVLIIVVFVLKRKKVKGKNTKKKKRKSKKNGKQNKKVKAKAKRKR